jgi:protein phosphatase 1G
MQGWRVSMEDSHIADLKLGEGRYIFGVFDGHGGGEVSEFVKRHFVKEFKNNQSYKQGNFGEALHETFM